MPVCLLSHASPPRPVTALSRPACVGSRPASSSPTTGPHGFRLPAAPPFGTAPPEIFNPHQLPRAPVNCTPKPALNPGPAAGAVLSKNAAIGPWRASALAPVRIAGGWIHGYAGAARRRGLGGHPNLDRITVAHPRNPLLHAGAAMDLFADVGVADSIMCGAHVVLDAGGEEEREYLDAGGGLLEDLSIGRKATMAIHPPYRATKNFLKPNLLKMHFSNKFVTTQVIHTPTATVVCSASSQEKLLKPNMESTRDISAAAKIEKLLGERLLVQGIPSVSIHLKREQKYHGKVRAVIDSVTEAGVKLL